MAQTFDQWLTYLAKPKWVVTLHQALLGMPLQYLLYRFRYFLLNNLLSTALHLFEFYLLGIYFSTAQFFGLILLRAFTLIIKNAWWGALEYFRERVRQFMALSQPQQVAHEINVACYLALIVGVCSVVFGVGLLVYFAHQVSGKTTERFLLYGSAMLLQLFLELMVRVIHSGIFAMQRIYRPWWTIPLAEVLGIITILILLPIGRLWCLPVSYIVFSSTSLYMTWYYARMAYHMQNMPIRIAFSKRHFKAWYAQLPLTKISLAALASAAMSLEGILLWLVYPLVRSDPNLFKLLYLLSPQVSAGFDWARMCYFDLKKLHAVPKWSILSPRFFHCSFQFAVVLGMIFWLLGMLTVQLFLPTISFFILISLLPLFMARSLLAYRQIQLFAKNYYGDIIMGAGLLIAAILLSRFFSPLTMLLFIFMATVWAIILALCPWFSELSFLPRVRPVPLYHHFDWLRGYDQRVHVVYMEFASNLPLPKRHAFLAQIAGLLDQSKISFIHGYSKLLLSMVESESLEKIKPLLLGLMVYYQSTGWQENGKQALSKAFFLKKRLFNFNEQWPAPLSDESLEAEFLTEFPQAKRFLVPQLMKVNFIQHILPEESYTLADAIARGWFFGVSKIKRNHYCSLYYWGHNKKVVFIVKAHPDKMPVLKKWQRRCWQLSCQP